MLVLFSYLAVGCHMRDRHPSISFLQYKATHFQDPKAAPGPTTTPASARQFLCQLCRRIVTEPLLRAHLVHVHRNYFQQEREEEEDDDEIQAESL